MIGVGREVAKVVTGGHSSLLYPFRYERFATGDLHPVSNSPYPWSYDLSASPPQGGIPHLGEAGRPHADDDRAVSVSPLSSSSAALDLLTSGLDGSTASAALTGQGGAAAADPNFEDALFQQSGDPSLSQAAYADPGLAPELSALQALVRPVDHRRPVLDGPRPPGSELSAIVHRAGPGEPGRAQRLPDGRRAVA